jgi:hypothetical protein
VAEPEELCLKRLPSNAMCTMPKGHTGDHIAESVRRGNIIDAARDEDVGPADYEK